ncbi:MAG: GtrA family protein [Cytophagaceae bacterium]
MLQKIILKIIDPFHPLVGKFIDIKTYRYAACGAGNTAFDILLYFVFYNFVLLKQVHYLGSLAISAHIAAFLMAFIISFPTGFLLMRYVVFTESSIKGGIQLVRYFGVVILNILLNYSLLKLFVEYFNLYPTPSKFIATVIIVTLTYLLQKHFTFKEKLPSGLSNEPENIDEVEELAEMQAK